MSEAAFLLSFFFLFPSVWGKTGKVDEVAFEIQIIAGECAAVRDAGAYQNDFK